MTAIELTFNANDETADLYSDYLNFLGATSVTLQDNEAEPLYEPPLNTTPIWKKTRVSALFPADVDINLIKDFLKNHLDQETFNTLQTAPLVEKNWLEAWREHFKPMRFGKNLMVLPHDTPVPDQNVIPLFLDPGMAFGTGTHPTTRLCLEWLASHPLKDSLVIDYGSGSGILSLAALKLGASFVYAIDHDPQAILSTQQNAARNGYLVDHITALLPHELVLHKKADVILANILLNPLILLAETFAKQLDAEGTLIISGILEDQQMLLAKHYERFFSVQSKAVEDGWARMTFTALF
jgi:ribosomal protein L11 methyltransferase